MKFMISTFKSTHMITVSYSNFSSSNFPKKCTLTGAQNPIIYENTEHNENEMS